MEPGIVIYARLELGMVSLKIVFNIVWLQPSIIVHLILNVNCIHIDCQVWYYIVNVFFYWLLCSWVLYVRVCVCTCDYVYVGVHAYSHWGWRVLVAGRFINVCVSRRVFITCLRNHVHGCMYAYIKKMLYYLIITKFTVTECKSHFFLLMFLLKITNWYKTKSVLISGWLPWLCLGVLHASDPCILVKVSCHIFVCFLCFFFR